MFDLDDPSNRPVPGDVVMTWWSIYPEQFRRVFTQAFTAGLRDASLYGRVTEGTWRRVLLGLHDCVCAARAAVRRCSTIQEQPKQLLLALHRSAARPPPA